MLPLAEFSAMAVGVASLSVGRLGAMLAAPPPPTEKDGEGGEGAGRGTGAGGWLGVVTAGGVELTGGTETGRICSKKGFDRLPMFVAGLVARFPDPSSEGGIRTDPDEPACCSSVPCPVEKERSGLERSNETEELDSLLKTEAVVWLLPELCGMRKSSRFSPSSLLRRKEDCSDENRTSGCSTCRALSG